MMETRPLVKDRFHAVGTLLLTLFVFLEMSFAGEFKATGVDNDGDVAVISGEGNYDAENFDDSDISLPRQEIAREFFKTHPDNYDFLVIFTNFDFQMPRYQIAGESVTAAGFYNSVRNDTQGIGNDVFDTSSLYGSAGKLQGVIDMGPMAQKTSDPMDPDFSEIMTILSHELLHRWAAYVHFMKDGEASDALLGSNASHWSFLLDTKGSMQYGNAWRDNQNGTFTSAPGHKYYSQLDLYLMGLISKTEVEPMLLIENSEINHERFPQTGVTIAGTPRYVTIEEIIALEGERIPDYTLSQKSFKVGAILLIRPGTLNESDIGAVKTIMKHWVVWFSSLTDGKASVVPDASPVETIPVNQGVEPPPLDPREVPSEINDAVTWLMDNQNGNGSWLDSFFTSERDTSEALIALNDFPAAGENLAVGLQWLSDIPSLNTDFLSRKIEALSQSAQAVTPFLDELLGRQNLDGGWGASAFYLTDPADTALALKSLGECGYTNTDVIEPAVTYLIAKQNPDGGWGGEDLLSHIQTTVNVLLAFGRYTDSYSLDTQIEKGLFYLAGKQNPDGGFGNSPSTVYDTAAAVMALKQFGGHSEDMTRGVEYIQTQQSKNGSWYDSPYQTASAVNALCKAKRNPDLSVSAGNITLSPETVTTLPCDMTITVKVNNTGFTDALQAKVALYDGAIADEKKVAEWIGDISGNGMVDNISFNLTIADGKRHYLYVVADPDKAINDFSRADNSAMKIVYPPQTYDLAITDGNLILSTHEIDLYQPVTINADISNKGTMDALNVDIRYVLNIPGQPYEIAIATIDVPAGQTVNHRLTWTPSVSSLVGRNIPLTVELDTLHHFSELDEENNTTSAAFAINAVHGPNLMVSKEDITISPSPANRGGSAEISAMIRNTGDESAVNFEVGFYNGDPDAGGIILGTQAVQQLDAGASMAVSVVWPQIAVSGEKVIAVRVDDKGAVTEASENDNQSFKKLTILSLPDLALSQDSFQITPQAPKEGDSVTVQIFAQNKGGQSVSPVIRVWEGEVLLWSQPIPDFSGDSQKQVSFTYNTTGKKGVHTLTVKIDPDNTIHESDENNNRIERSFGVQDSNLWLSETVFSPNGDKIKDKTQFSFKFDTAKTVRVLIWNSAGEVVRSYSGTELSHITGGAVVWDGRDDDGRIVPDGKYRIQLIDQGGNILASLPVTIDSNQSPLTEAIGTPYMLQNNLTCQLPDISKWEWLPDESGILCYCNENMDTAYPGGIYFVSPDGQDITRIGPMEWNGRSGSDFYYQYEGGAGSFWNEKIFSLSPDGRNVLFILKKYDKNGQFLNSTLYKADVYGASPPESIASFEYQDQAGNILTGKLLKKASWSPDGQKIVYQIWDEKDPLNKHGELYIYDGLNASQVPTIPWYDEYAWSPDFAALAYIHNGIVTVSDLAGNRTDVFETGNLIHSIQWLDQDKMVVVERYYAWGYQYKIWLVDTQGVTPPFLVAEELKERHFGVEGLTTFIEPKIQPMGERFAFIDYSIEGLGLVTSNCVRSCDLDGDCIVLYEYPEGSIFLDDIVLDELRWSPDGKKVAFIDFTDRQSNQDQIDPTITTVRKNDGARLVTVDIETREITEVYVAPLVTEDNSSFHIYSQERGSWVEKEVLHFDDVFEFETKTLNLERSIEDIAEPYTIRIIQKGKDVANIDYIQLTDGNGTLYPPDRVMNVTTGQDILEALSCQGDAVSADVAGSTIDLVWENLPRTSISLSLHAIEPASYYIDGTLNWHPDNKTLSLMREDRISVVKTEKGTKSDISIKPDEGYLYNPPYRPLSLSPLGNYMTYDFIDRDSPCFENSESDLWNISSLLNDEAILKVTKTQSGVRLEGIATDWNFDHYSLEYADVNRPDIWEPVTPPSDLQVIDDFFTIWIPPYEGVFAVRLTVADKAGNLAQDIASVTWRYATSISNIYLTEKVYSPAIVDGSRDDMTLCFTVNEPTYLDFQIYDTDGKPIKSIKREYASIPANGGKDCVEWDGRNAAGDKVPNGKYTIQVFDYQFSFEIDNIFPFAAIDSGKIGIWKADSLDNFGEIAIMSDVTISDDNLKEWVIENGAGSNPTDWQEYVTGDQPDSFTLTFRNDEIALWTGNQFRLTASDKAGNKTIKKSGGVEEERLIINKVNSNYLLFYDEKEDDDFIHTGDISQEVEPYVHRLEGFETIHAPIVTMNVLSCSDEECVDGPDVSFDPSESAFDINWDYSYLENKPFDQVRIKAIDAEGMTYLSNPLIFGGGGHEISLTSECLDGRPVYQFSQNLLTGSGVFRFQVRSDKDSRYQEWTDYGVMDSATGPIPAVQMIYSMWIPADINYTLGYEAYSLRIVATRGTKQWISNEMAFPKQCLSSGSSGAGGVSFEEAEGCDVLSTGEATVSAEGIQEFPQTESLKFYLEKDGEWELLKESDLTVESLTDFTINTNSLPEGEYRTKWVVTYRENGQLESAAREGTLTVDRTIPNAALTSPEEGAMLCPAMEHTTLEDKETDWSSVTVTGSANDSQSVKRAVLTYRLNEENSEWRQAVTVNDAGAHVPFDMTKNTKWDVTGLSGDYILHLKVLDGNGNTACSDISVSIDAKTGWEVTPAAFENTFVTPSDPVELTYSAFENLSIDVEAWRLPDNTLVRTIVPHELKPAGTNTASWDMKDDVGNPVSDDLYAVKIRATDSCGNTESQEFKVTMDQTPPVAVISFPLPGDLTASQVEIRGCADDENFKEYKLEILSSGDPLKVATIPVQDGVLGRWNIFGLEGDYTIRLTATDKAGNVSETVTPVHLIKGADLVKSVHSDPTLFSPNGDGQLESTIISYELNPAISGAFNVTIEIFKDQTLVKTDSLDAIPAGNYEYQWDGVENAGDGLYTLYLTASLSSNGAVFQKEKINLMIDTAPPAINFSQPQMNAAYQGNLIVKGTVSDPHMANCLISYAGGTGSGTLYSGAQSKTNYLFGSVNDMADGNYTLTVTSEDLGKNRAQQQIPFIIDRTPPAPKIISPEGVSSFTTGNALTVKFAIDEKNPDQYTLRYRKGDMTDEWHILKTGSAVPTGSQEMFVWDVSRESGIADGQYILSLYARDLAGWEKEVRTAIRIDNTPPEISINAPVDGSYVKGPVDITGRVYDLNLKRYTVEISEGSCESAYKWSPLSTGTASVENGLLASLKTLPKDGAYCLRITAEDNAGKNAVEARNIIIDTTPPASPQLTGRVDNQADVMLTWIPNSEADIAGYILYRNGIKLNTHLLMTLAYQDQGVPDGVYSYTLKAVDKAGWESEPSTHAVLRIDHTPPTARIMSPADGAIVKEIYQIKGTAFSSENFKEYRLYVRANATLDYTLIRTSPVPVSYGLLAQNTIPVNDGDTCTLKLETEDLNGNINTHLVTVTIDRTPPSPPVGCTVILNDTSASIDWEDNTETDLSGYLLYRNNELVNSSGIVSGNLTPYILKSSSYTDTGLPDGAFEYRISAVDKAGNTSESLTPCSAVVDTHAPHATIVTPENGHRFGQTLMIKAESPDLDIAAIQFQVRKTSESTLHDIGEPVRTRPFAVYLDPLEQGLDCGDYYLKAIATDTSGHTDSAPGSILVTYTDLTPPAAPSNLKSLVNGGNVALTWQANSEPDLAGYAVYQTISGIRIRLTGAIQPATGYNLTGLKDESYIFEVTAIDTNGNESPPSSKAAAIVYTPILSPAVTLSREPAIHVTGKNARPNASVDIAIDTCGQTPCLTIVSGADGGFAFDAPLTTGTNHITVKVTDGEGNISKVSAALTVAYSDIPAPPKNFTAKAQGDDITLSWTANSESDLAGYFVERNAGSDWQRLNAGSSLMENGYLDSDLPQGKYTYRVVAVDTSGNQSGPSNEASADSDTVPPPMPVIDQPTVHGVPITATTGKTTISGTADFARTVELYQNGFLAGKVDIESTNLLGEVAFLGNNNTLSVISGGAISPDGGKLAYMAAPPRMSPTLFIREIASGDETQVAEGGSNPSWSPDGTMLLYTYPTIDRTVRIGLYTLATGESQPLTTDTGVSESSPSWSMDSKTVLFASARAGRSVDAWSMDIETGILTQLTSGVDISYPQYSPSGVMISFLDRSGTLYITDLTTGAMAPVTQTAAITGSPKWSPIGNRLAFTNPQTRGTNSLFVYDLQSGVLVQVTASDSYIHHFGWSPDGTKVFYAGMVPGGDPESGIWTAPVESMAPGVLLKQIDMTDLLYAAWTETGVIHSLENDPASGDIRLFASSSSSGFTFPDVSLNHGKNTFYAVSIDGSGNRSPKSMPITVNSLPENLPDLSVSEDDIWIYPASPVTGEMAVISLSVENKGNVPADNVALELYLTGPQGQVSFLKSETIPHMDPHGRETIQAEWDTAGYSGEFTVVVNIDPENQVDELLETNNLGRKEGYVAAEEGVSMVTLLSPDLTGLGNELGIDIRLANSGIGTYGDLTLRVEDTNGSLVTVIDTENIYLPYGFYEVRHFTFDTSGLLAGTYQVRTLLKEAALATHENRVSFDISPDIRTDLSMVTDRKSYHPNETVKVFVNTKNLGINYIIPESTVGLTIKNEAGETLYTEYKPLSTLLPGTTVTLPFTWNAGLNLPGEYHALVELFIENESVAGKEAAFEITGATFLSGKLFIAPAVVSQGEPLKANYTITNSGNIPTGDLSTKVLIVDPESGAVLDEQETTVTIGVNQQVTGELSFTTAGYPLKRFQAILQYIGGTETETLAAGSFSVRDVIPPVVTVLAPENGQTYELPVPVSVNTADDASGVESVMYRVDDGIWMPLPLSDQSRAIYSSVFGPLSLESGLHTFWFKAVDFSGNESESVAREITIEKPFETLTGQLSVDPSQVSQGHDATFQYQIENPSSRSFEGIHIHLRVFDPFTGHTLATLADTIDLPAASSALGTFVYPVLGLDVGIYQGILVAVSGTETGERILAHTDFPVIPNLGPVPPTIGQPADGTEVTLRTPSLSVHNTPDPEEDPVTYTFQLGSVPEMTDIVAEGENIPETENATAFTPGVLLDDNTWYYWRVRAADLFHTTEWTYGRFFVNTQNDAPGPFFISSPEDGAGMDTMTPLLEVTNSVDIDGDTLHYRFMLYSENDPVTPVAVSDDIPEGENGSTSYRVESLLEENTWYTWSAEAEDEHGLLTDAGPARFFVNTQNDAPGPPSVVSPANGEELASVQSDLTAGNAIDPDNDALAYFFEIDTVNTFDSPALRVSGPVLEGSGTTLWRTPSLTDNTRYYWRVKASDGSAESPWATETFFVNTTNDPPTVPALKNPGEGAWVPTLTPSLELHPSTDPDNDLLTYELELYADPGLTGLVAHGVFPVPSMVVGEPLMDNHRYYFRARAIDTHGAMSGWTAPFLFFTDSNGIDDAPTIQVTGPGTAIFTNESGYTITWWDSDPDSNANISLYSDTDGSGADGTLIVSGLSEDPDESSDTWTWDLTAVPEGTYYVYAVIHDGATSGVTGYSQGTLTIDRTPPVVTATPVGGIYAMPQSIALDADETADIRYTLDGSPPTADSILYTGPITLTGSTEIRFIGIDRAGNISPVKTEIYTKQVIHEGYHISNCSVFAINSISMKAGSEILSGNLTVAYAQPFIFSFMPEVSLDSHVYMHDEVTVYADTIATGYKTSLADIHYNYLTGIGTVRGTKTRPLSLPLPVSSPQFPNPQPGTTYVEVPRNGTTTLTPGAYGKIVVKEGGTLVFAPGVYHLLDVNLIHCNAQLRCSGAVTLVIRNWLWTDYGAYIGPAAGSGVTGKDIKIYTAACNFYVGTLGILDLAVEIGPSSTVFANIYAPRGTIHAHTDSKIQGALFGKDVKTEYNVQISMDNGF